MSIAGVAFLATWVAGADAKSSSTDAYDEAELRRLMKEILAEEGIGVAGVRNGRFVIESPDRTARLNVGGRIQPRFEYERREDEANVGRARFRRLRIDFRGYVVDENLTFRVMPEFKDNARLDTAYVNYRFSDRLQVRAGQFNVPFAWERDVSSNRHQLTERSTANNTFQWPGGGGKDVGVTLHGGDESGVRHAVGVFGGEGRNAAGDGTEGIMTSGRVTWSPLGSYPRTETPVQPVEGKYLSFGAGAWFANQSAVRDWFPWDDDAQTAHAFAHTLDAHWQQGRLSAHASGFLRWVEPREDAFSSYNGNGFNVQAGWLIVAERLFGAVRYSQAAPDDTVDEGKSREVIGGIQIFHSGHRSKVHLEAGWEQRHDGDAWRDTELARVQYQLLF